MLRIFNIRTEKNEEKYKLMADISVPVVAIQSWKKKSISIDAAMNDRYRTEYLGENSVFTMWYEVDKQYSFALCNERSDAFLAAVIYFAMVSGEDIQCEIPVTDKLLYQMKEYLIPSLCNEMEGYRHIEIIAEAAPEVEKISRCVGTGTSCGVDSFSTILLHTKDTLPSAFKLTHLTLFNTGSLNFSGYSKDKPLNQWRIQTEIEFAERIELGKKVADELGLQFISVDSNIPDLYQGCFLYSHTFRNLSAILATQKMWSNYYYASAGEGTGNLVGLKNTCAQYDFLNTMVLSLNSLNFYSGGVPYKRMKKVEIIADNPVVQKNINVCSFHTKNCGHCAKCIRTLTALDLLGKLELFKESFDDMSYYKKNRWKIRATISEATEEDYFAFDMKQYMENRAISLDWKSKLYHYLVPLRKIWIWIHKLG